MNDLLMMIFCSSTKSFILLAHPTKQHLQVSKLLLIWEANYIISSVYIIRLW